MIQYHGWADDAVAPRDSIRYYESVASFMNANAQGRRAGSSFRATQGFYRLFMVPGMGHCWGGPGADNFGNKPGLPSPKLDAEHDVVSALERWVESGVPPERIIATKSTEGSAAKGEMPTHLLCPYPQVAVWTGRGGKDSAGNFVCRLPSQ